MTNAVIYHNPRCSKSRQTLQLLQDNQIQPTVIEYLQTPLSKTQVKQVLKLLQLTPREMMRTKETIYKEQKLSDPSKTPDELIQAMVDHPILIERPIVIINNQKAVIGRPPENVLEIL